MLIVNPFLIYEICCTLVFAEEKNQTQRKKIVRKNHSKYDRMETCAEAWDAYHKSGGMLCLKSYWARGK
jgi:hypothetical protein